MKKLPPQRPGSQVPAVPRRSRSPLFKLAFAGLREVTMRLYAKDWERFLAYAGLGFPEFFGLAKSDAAVLVNEYLEHMEAEGKAPATRARAKQAICSITDKLYVAGEVEWTLAGLKLLVSPDVTQYGATEGLEHDAWCELLRTVQSDGTDRGTRDTAILLLLHDSALRSREVATLRLRDWDRAKGLVRAWGKGKDVANRVSVPCNARTVAALDAWCEIRHPHAQLFHPLGAVGAGRPRAADGAFRTSDVAYAVRDWCRRAGIEPVVGPHQLRHARITWLARAGMPLHDLRIFARHQDVNTTLHYVRANDSSVREWTEKT